MLDVELLIERVFGLAAAVDWAAKPKEALLMAEVRTVEEVTGRREETASFGGLCSFGIAGRLNSKLAAAG